MPRILGLLILLVSSIALAASPNGTNRTIPAVQVAGAPKIDGDLSDPCWQNAPTITDFYFLASGSKASEPTTAWICYDETAIYVAFYCRDSEPDKIAAQQKKRGGSIDTDDYVEFELDPYCTFQRQKSSTVRVSAGGVQVEDLQSGDVSKIEWKGDWTAATKRVSDGYTVELAVPWRILQYDPAGATMGISFVRRHARSKQEWWAPNLGPGEDPKNCYLWEGLKLPNQRSRPLVLPYILYGAGEGDSPSEAGMDVKYAFTPSLTGLMTFKPDFRNVEQDVESIDFTYTARYLPDNRPFFQEGNMYYPSREMFYSRSIEDLDFGAKLTGRYRDYQIAALNCGRLDDARFSMVHVTREWPAKGNVRFAAVQSALPGADNLATCFSAGYRVLDKNDVKMHLQGRFDSADAASGSGRGDYSFVSLFNSGKPRVLGWQIDHTAISPDFDPYLGYVPEKGISGWGMWASLHDELPTGKLSSWQLTINGDLTDRWDGSSFHKNLSASYMWDWRSGNSMLLRASAGRRIVTPGGDVYDDRRVGMSYLWGTRDLYDRGGFGFEVGRVAGGRYLNYGLGQAWSAGHNLSCSLDYYYTSIAAPSPEAYSASQIIGTLAYDIDTERTLAGRIVAQLGHTNVYFAYRQRVRSGMDVYVIYGDPNAQSNRNTVLLKLLKPI